MVVARQCLRSIPACAGEPRAASSSRSRSKVYPRVCGGTVFQALICYLFIGLSPRVRGNPASPGASAHHGRSIPACAGEPGLAGSNDLLDGLSPRVRGNHPVQTQTNYIARSIPACAGEPDQLVRSIISPGGLSPRVRGNLQGRADCSAANGLSPRVRGNQSERHHLFACIRSIPRCAGEPGRCHIPRYMWWVYPRVCGGTGPE